VLLCALLGISFAVCSSAFSAEAGSLVGLRSGRRGAHMARICMGERVDTRPGNKERPGGSEGSQRGFKGESRFGIRRKAAAATLAAAAMFSTPRMAVIPLPTSSGGHELAVRSEGEERLMSVASAGHGVLGVLGFCDPPRASIHEKKYCLAAIDEHGRGRWREGEREGGAM